VANEGRPPASGRGPGGRSQGGSSGRGDGPAKRGASGGGRDGAPARRGDAPGRRDGGGGRRGASTGASTAKDSPFSRPRSDNRRDDRRPDAREERREDSRGDRRGDRTSSDRSRTVDQARYDGPEIDEAITGKELDHNVAQQLRGLPEKLAARVARHLVAAGMLLEDDPKTAYQHTLAARARASRIAVVREACGEAAYAAGEFADALAELRAAKRMNGSQDYLPVMADCERALGRPDRALALARNPAVANLEPGLKAEMTIVEAGARRDLGELDAALRTLENAPLRSRTRAGWVVRLRYAYADTLLAAGRTEDALEWFHRTVGSDGDQSTDAAERVQEIEGRQR
jgi:hypothetical protein